MKKVYRHKPLEKAAPKTRKKVAPKPSAIPPMTDEELYSHPIFHTEFAGKLVKYIRPFDPVWPSEPQK